MHVNVESGIRRFCAFLLPLAHVAAIRARNPDRDVFMRGRALASGRSGRLTEPGAAFDPSRRGTTNAQEGNGMLGDGADAAWRFEGQSGPLRPDGLRYRDDGSPAGSQSAVQPGARAPCCPHASGRVTLRRIDDGTAARHPAAGRASSLSGKKGPSVPTKAGAGPVVPRQPKIASGSRAETTKLGTSTTLLMRRSTATLHITYA